MHLLYLFPEPLPLPKARAIQVIKTVAALAGQGARVDLAYVPVPGIDDPFAHYGITRPAAVRLVPLSRQLPGILGRLRMHSNRFFLARVRRWLREAERAGERPQVAFVRHLKLAAGLLAACPELPIIYEAHEVFADTAPPAKVERLARLERRVIAESRVCIAITAALADALRKRFGIDRPIPVVPSATDLLESAPHKDWTRSAQSILYAGSLYPWKGVDDLVLAGASLAGCTIEIVGGDGPGIERCQGLQVPEGAVFTYPGTVSHRAAQQKMADACIAVLPNRAGSVSAFTSPLKLFEYMACGCAIVVSDLPVFREVLGEDDAFWYQAGNPEALAKAIQTALADPGQMAAMGERVRQKVRAYAWPERAAALLRLMENAEMGASQGNSE